jgi:hypothetical protein
VPREAAEARQSSHHDGPGSAPGDVREAAGRVDAVYRALFETQMALGPEAPFQERLISAYVQHRDDVAAAREQLVARVQASR